MSSVHLTENLALAAAHAFAGQQDYPAATLYMVATPIGNLADITLRALHTLSVMDAIACEDTRHTGALLAAYGISKPLLAAHEHNEREAAQTIATHLARGERIAYVSDAGTPGVSDPGGRLAASVRAAGHRVVPLPGASSITCLLSAAGMVEGSHAGYVFHGFLSTKAKERTAQVQAMAGEPRAALLLEAPHRIAALLQALAVLGDRPLTIGRELTKQFEEIATLPASAAPAWLEATAHRKQGEFALLLHPTTQEDGQEQHQEGLRVLALLQEHLPTKTAVKLASDITGAPRNWLYDQALQGKGGA